MQAERQSSSRKAVPMYRKIKARLYEILEKPSRHDPLSKFVESFIFILILLNVLLIIIETIPTHSEERIRQYMRFEYVSVFIFTLEYILRLWVCNLDHRYAGSFTGRLRYAVSPMAIIDLMAVLPLFLGYLIPLDIKVIRALRLLRMFRLLKLARYSRPLKTIWKVIKEKREDLISAFSLVLIVLVIASTLFYYFEHDSQPQKMASIPDAMWWAVSTLATVGYGDVCPVTKEGKIISAIMSLMGVAMFALPTAILGSGFIEEMQSKKGRRKPCPHCGRNINTHPENPPEEEAPIES
jgi:voltage-gated potassium channel